MKSRERRLRKLEEREEERTAAQEPRERWGPPRDGEENPPPDPSGIHVWTHPDESEAEG